MRDHEIITAQFTGAGADVTHKLMDRDHAIGDEDLAETKAWLQRHRL